MGVACDGDGGIDALCSQINTSFAKPSDELFSTGPPPLAPPTAPPSAVNGAPPCSVPPLLPPPPAPGHATSPWVQPDAPLQSPPAASAAAVHVGHRRTPSEAERWLEEVSKAVKTQQTPPAPVSSSIPVIPGPPPMTAPLIPLTAPLLPMATPLLPLSSPSVVGPPVSLPSMSVPTVTPPSVAMQPFPSATVGVFGSPPVPPAFVPVQTYVPGYAPSPGAVPIVGITPSQMVANVFCSATPPNPSSSSSNKTGGSASLSYASPPHSAGFTTSSFPASMNGAGLANGSTVSVSSWPPEGSQLTTTTTAAGPAQEDDRFEAKWAALETKPGSNAYANSATNANANANAAANPFSSNLQKTFEIEL